VIEGSSDCPLVTSRPKSEKEAQEVLQELSKEVLPKNSCNKERSPRIYTIAASEFAPLKSKVKVEGRHWVNAIIDTGAGISLIQEEFLQTLANDVKKKLSSFTDEVKGIGGRAILTKGLVKLKISMCGQSKTIKCVVTP
jgi:hypothetical protein